MELPTFEGSYPLGWISRAEKYFEVQNVTPKEKLSLAFISMEGNASHWFRFWRQKTKNPSWEELTTTLSRSFGGSDRSTVFKRLATIRQIDMVKDYIQEFELLASQIPQVSEKQLLGYSFARLQTKIRNQIKPHDPKGLVQAMEIAHDVEDAMIQVITGGEMSYRNTNSSFRYKGGLGIVSRMEPFIKGKGIS